jgi:hypothetical protein
MPGNPHPWRIMTAVLGGVLLFSVMLQKLFTPAGDAVLRAATQRQAIIASRKGPDKVPASAEGQAIGFRGFPAGMDPRAQTVPGDRPRHVSCHGCHGES